MAKSIFLFFRKYWYATALLALGWICLISVLISPVTFWPSIFASYSIPVLLTLSIFLLVVFFIFKKEWIVFPLLMLIAGMPFVWITYSFNFPRSLSEESLSVLSYNAKLFRERDAYEKFSSQLIQWSVEDSSDIKCFQEYSTNSRWLSLDVTKLITEKGYHDFTYSAEVVGSHHNPGLAIFSKYDIVSTGFVWKKKGTLNAGIYADIKHDNDTIRVYNVHLESMRLDLSSYQKTDNYWSKIKDLISRLKEGAKMRSEQIEKVIEHTKSCPYPFIICGDFNETPYGYNYFRLKENFSNAFDEAGRGFGFSFNDRLFFLRIDHQFYSKSIIPLDFKVDRSIKISDHFPTRGYYDIVPFSKRKGNKRGR